MSIFYKYIIRIISIFVLMDVFNIISPSLHLAPFVKHYWALKTETSYIYERIIPTGCVQLIFHRGDKMYSYTEQSQQPQVFIGGQTSDFSDIQSTGKTDMLVVVFQPHGAKAFFNIPIDQFKNQNVSIQDLNDKPLLQLAEQVLTEFNNKIAIAYIENFLLSRLKYIHEYNHNKIAHIISKVNHKYQSDIKTLADQTFLSHKQFNRIFSDYVGTNPKDFIRIIRFQKAIHILQNDIRKSHISLAVDCDFYDQSHMIKDFKRFSGYTPKEYVTTFQPYSDYFSATQ